MKYLRLFMITGLLLAGVIALQPSKATAFNPFYITNGGGVTPVCNHVGAVKNAELCQEQYDQNLFVQLNPFTGNNGLLIRVSVLMAWIIGFASVGMIAYGGLSYIMSRGDAQKAVNARHTILYALVGLIVAVIAQATIAFTINHIS